MLQLHCTLAAEGQWAKCCV